MKGLIQWGTTDPDSWFEFDSSDWLHLPRRPEPVSGTPVPDDEGYGVAFNFQGTVFAGDRLGMVPLPDGLGVQVHEVWEDLEDYAVGWRHARVITIPHLGPDLHRNGAINARQSQTIYAEADVAAMMRYMGATNIHPWEEYKPLPDAVYIHGLWLPNDLYQAHAALHVTRGWREWVEGLDPRELRDRLCADGVVRPCVLPQRSQGRYVPAEGTRTYFHRDSTLTTSLHTADFENELLTGTGAAGEQICPTLGGGEDRICWAATTAANEPDNATWPTGNYRHDIDATSAGSAITFGLLTVGASDGHFARVNDARTTHVETKAQAEGAFSLPGIKPATTGSVSWGGSTQSDRFEIAIAAGRPASHGNQSITLELNESDDFADGPWVAAAGVPAGLRTLALTGAGV